MNINLSAAAAKQKKKKKSGGGQIQYGLNSRKSGGRGDVFGYDDDDDDSSSSSSNNNGIGKVNRDLASQQAALRKKLETSQEQYDFDGTYEDDDDDENKGAKSSLQHWGESSSRASAAKQQPQQQKQGSRYIGDLLKAAERRKHEREIIHERKLAREQAEEDAQEDYQGKEKFITKSYKRKLAERELWAKQDEQAKQQEEKDDVRKKKDGAAFATFYGNLTTRNVAMGGRENDDNDAVKNVNGNQNANDQEDASSSNQHGRTISTTKNISPDAGAGEIAAAESPTPRRPHAAKRQISYTFVDGFEMGTADIQDPDATNADDDDGVVVPIPEHQDDKDHKRRLADRMRREEKVAAAIKRYFLRHPDRKELSTSP